MTTELRGFHLHVSKDRHKPEELRWSVTATSWAVGGGGTSGTLASGRIPVVVRGGPLPQVAVEALLIALETAASELGYALPRRD